jgi:hypothetical protein
MIQLSGVLARGECNDEADASAGGEGTLREVVMAPEILRKLIAAGENLTIEFKIEMHGTGKGVWYEPRS